MKSLSLACLCWIVMVVAGCGDGLTDDQRRAVAIIKELEIAPDSSDARIIERVKNMSSSDLTKLHQMKKLKDEFPALYNTSKSTADRQARQVRWRNQHGVSSDRYFAAMKKWMETYSGTEPVPEAFFTHVQSLSADEVSQLFAPSEDMP